jgi:hypothetical protein
MTTFKKASSVRALGETRDGVLGRPFANSSLLSATQT